jgi:hypothetical protein
MDMTDWANVRQVSDPDAIAEAFRHAQRIRTSATALDEMRRRYPTSTPSTPGELAASRLYGAPIDVDPDVPEGFAFTGGLLLDFRT